jgi:hypothetical protein
VQYQISPSGIVEVGYADSQGRQLHLGPGAISTSSPPGGGAGAALNEVIGGWKLNTILRFHDGKPLQLTQNSNL